MIFGDIQELLVVVGYARLFLKILCRSFVKLVMNRGENLLYLFNDIVEGNEELLSAYTAYKNAGIVLDVTGTDLETERNTLHLVLAELPTCGVVAVVELYSELFGEKRFQFVSLFKHAFLVLSNGSQPEWELPWEAG